MFAEPDPTDENTSPEFLDECYQMYESLKYKPEDLTDLKEREAYRKWLENRQSSVQSGKTRRRGTEIRMPTTNIVEAILGREHLKWDASWRLFKWLLDPEEGHGLGGKVLEKFCLHTFGQSFPSCPMKLECQLSPVKDGKGKWVDLALAFPSLDAATHVAIMDDLDRHAPGSRRKLDNLAEYRSRATEKFPLAIVRLVVLTNASEGKSIRTKYGAAVLGSEAEDFRATVGWKLLPLSTVGDWVAEATSPPLLVASDKMKLFLTDFVEWSHSLDRD